MKRTFIVFLVSMTSFLASAHHAPEQPAPHAASCLELSHVDNATRNICDKNNKNYLLLEFFSPGCGACHRNVVFFKKLEEETKNFAHSRLVSSGSLHATQAFLNQHSITSQVALDLSAQARGAYAIRHYPTVILVDSKNQIIFQHAGVLNNNVMAQIKKLVTHDLE
jgi:thioredoxin-related protein